MLSVDMGTTVGRWLRLVAGCGLAVGLAGCGGQVADEDLSAAAGSAYEDDFEAAMVEASDFVRKVLSDFTITPEEQAEAQQRYFDCLIEHGIEAYWQTSPQGRRNVQTRWTNGREPTAEEESWELKCSRDWFAVIDSLYWSVIDNPSNEDSDDVTAACLIRKGLAPEGFERKDYAELTEAAGREPLVISEPGEFIVPKGSRSRDDVTLPNGVPLSDPRVELCEFAPGSG